MAKTESNTAEKAAKKPPMKLVIAVAVALALAGAGCGYLAGYFPLFPASAQKEAEAPVKGGPAAKAAGEAAKEHGKKEGAQAAAEGEQKAFDGKSLANNVYALDPIVTNIAMPADVWVRFEAVIKATEPLDSDVPQQIQQDILAFLRSMHLSELTGSSAFIDLKAELLSRANTRSAGKVDAIYIKTFLFE
jgi:flagellar protein FliL